MSSSSPPPRDQCANPPYFQSHSLAAAEKTPSTEVTEHGWRDEPAETNRLQIITIIFRLFKSRRRRLIAFHLFVIQIFVPNQLFSQLCI